MKPSRRIARDLLHLADHGALGTLLAGEPAQPFVTVMPFAPDADSAPVFLASGLAEHTRNLDLDARASLLLQADLPGEAGGVLAQTRMTLIGEARRCEPEAALIARFLRYQPDAERYLALGDFGFFRFHPRRARLIGGFGSMGWLDAAAILSPASLSPESEAGLLRLPSMRAAPGFIVLGVDGEGVDLRRDGRRERHHFAASLDPGRAEVQLVALLGTIG